MYLKCGNLVNAFLINGASLGFSLLVLGYLDLGPSSLGGVLEQVVGVALDSYR